MAAFDRATRRGRYSRVGGKEASLSSRLPHLLRLVADYELLSVPQLVRLTGLPTKTVHRIMRPAFDCGFVHVVCIPRSVLADPSGTNAFNLAFGSAPNIYSITKKGQAYLRELEMLDREKPVTRYGPQNAFFLAHRLLVKDIRIWLSSSQSSEHGLTLTTWLEEQDAVMNYSDSDTKRAVRPDAWFRFSVGESTLLGIVEADRGTMRGHRWTERLALYEGLYSSGKLKQITGFVNARLLIVTTGAKRRDNLCALIEKHASPKLAERIWVADKAVLTGDTLCSPAWRCPGTRDLHPLLPPSLYMRELAEHTGMDIQPKPSA